MVGHSTPPGVVGSHSSTPPGVVGSSSDIIQYLYIMLPMMSYDIFSETCMTGFLATSQPFYDVTESLVCVCVCGVCVCVWVCGCVMVMVMMSHISIPSS